MERADGDLGFGLAAAAGDPSVALAEQGVGTGRAGDRLAEAVAQPTAALVLLAFAGAGSVMESGTVSRNPFTEGYPTSGAR
jgi:hypothetical protein